MWLHRFFRLGWVLMLCLFWQVARAEPLPLSVVCVGCAPLVSALGEADTTPELMALPVSDQRLELVWSSTTDPASQCGSVHVVAGDPMASQALPDRGPLRFERVEEAALWQARHALSSAEVGPGTWIAALVCGAQRRSGFVAERLIHWRAWRVLRPQEQRREQSGVQPASSAELVLSPAALRARSAGGRLPAGAGGDQQAWFSLVDHQGALSDIDLDGECNGVPGVNLGVLGPWEGGASPQSARRWLLDQIAGSQGQTVSYGDFTWLEQEPAVDVALVAGSGRRAAVRYYYAVATMSSQASVCTLQGADLGHGGPAATRRYLAHETLSRGRQDGRTPHPRLWASYDRREYGADPLLLEMLRRQYGASPPAAVAGFRQPSMVSGAPSETVFHWNLVSEINRLRVTPDGWIKPAFVAVDVVAFRSGQGRRAAAPSKGGAGPQWWVSALQRLGIASEQEAELPRGYRLVQPRHRPLTLTGVVPMLADAQPLAQRGVVTWVSDKLGRTQRPRPAAQGSSPEQGLPTRASIVLSADLSSGALIEAGLVGKEEQIYPIDAYAQWVLRFAVILDEDDALLVSAPLPPSTPAPNPGPSVRARHLGWVFGFALICAAVGLSLFFPGFRALLNACFLSIARRLDATSSASVASKPIPPQTPASERGDSQ